MKTPEDEAFDDLAKQQGAWGGGFKVKRQMAADKLLEEATRSCNNIDEQRALDALMREAQPAPEPYDQTALELCEVCGWKTLIPSDGCLNCGRAQPAQEPVAKPYAYEYGRCNADGTYSVVIERGDLVQTMPAVYNYVRPRNAHKDWPIKELFDAPPQREWNAALDEAAARIGEIKGFGPATQDSFAVFIKGLKK